MAIRTIRAYHEAVRKRVIKLTITWPNGGKTVGTFTEKRKAVKWASEALLRGLTVGCDFHRYRLASFPPSQASITVTDELYVDPLDIIWARMDAGQKEARHAR